MLYESTPLIILNEPLKDGSGKHSHNPPRHMQELMIIRSSISEKSEDEEHDLGLETPEKVSILKVNFTMWLTLCLPLVC